MTSVAETDELEFDQACFVIERDADFIACAPPELIVRNLDWILEARERLNDALAKAGRVRIAA